MIAIMKGAAPAILISKGEAEKTRICTDFDACPDDYCNGKKTHTFAGSIYAAKSVKERLKAAQHEKCAFCESIFSQTGYGDVEHFRPKGGYQQSHRHKLVQPGYYWLAYDWENLFYSCQICNQQFKKNLFPLKDQATRAKTHSDDISIESRLLVDPAKEDPAVIIGFRQEFAYAIGGNPVGKKTIEVLGLNREPLLESRRDRLSKLYLLMRFRDLLKSKVKPKPTSKLIHELRNIESDIAAARALNGEYAAMSRAFLDGLI